MEAPLYRRFPGSDYNGEVLVNKKAARENIMTRIEEVLYEDDFIFAICKFLEEFRYSKNKYEMICDEPQGDFDNVNGCIMAAISHKLANDSAIDIPPWVNKDKYFLSEPVYAHDTKNKDYQEFLRKDSPYEFASRNIFCGSNAIERV